MKDYNERQGDYIGTYNGRFYPLDPRLEDIDIETIAHALSHLCRFGGHTVEFYSVAQHSVLCAEQAPDEYKLEALLHDSTEAYLVDVPRPIKRMLKDYMEIENQIYKSISEKFNIPIDMSPIVKEIDNRILTTEASQLLNNKKDEWWKLPHYAKPYDFRIYPVSPKVAKEMFLSMFNTLNINK
jgi:5'-deoxynucleotidase YfbR-like HD superfamily hydrolase